MQRNYRGKRKDTGEWVYGYLYINSNDERHFILIDGDLTEDFTADEVIPETVGQCTGVSDKNGKEIYEADIVRFIDGIIINGSNTHQSPVEWLHELSGFYIHSDCIGYYQVNPSQCSMYYYEVIGNIYEDGDLIVH